MACAPALASRSLWAETVEVPNFAALRHDTTADVCIVGAGIAGLTTAYMLGRLGKKVVVLDDGPITSGQTPNTTAHLASAIDDHFTEIERLHGAEGSRLAAESHSAAIDAIERIVREEKIVCDFQRLDGYLFVPLGDDPETLNEELAAAKRTGVIAVERVRRAPVSSFDTGPCLRFLNQGQFHPLVYLAHLSKCIQRDGGRIYSFTHASQIEGGERARIETQAGPVVTAAAVVVATNTPVNDRVAIHTKQAPYISYVIAGRIPRGSVPRVLLWDTADPYHYIRLQPDHQPDEGHNGHAYDMLIVGGEDHKTGQADDGAERFDRLEHWTRHRFPMLESIEHRWSGQVMETIDGLAFIGRNPLDKDNVYVATGDSGMGMTHGTIAGILLSQLILGNEHPWRTLYDPARKTLRAAGEFTRENLNVAAEYGAWLTPGDLNSEDEIPPGCGAVLRRGLNKVAVYRSEAGELIRLSAVCPHLKCIVAWNAVERTWDCPCHGSRFGCDGVVLNGPANTNLPAVESE